MNFVSTHEETKQLLRVVQKTFLSTNVVEFEFEDSEAHSLPEWEPGSHIDLKLEDTFSRQYSLMRGKLNPNNWRIAVLIEEAGRGGSRYLAEKVEENSFLNSVGPRNHFPLVEARDYFFVAGGIGITPLIPMIEHVEKAGNNWALAYLGRSHSSMAYVDDLVSLYPGKVSIFPKSEGKEFSVRNSISSISSETLVYSCGPEKLITALELEMGMQIGQLHVERFHPREIVLDEPDHEFTVYCKKSDEEIVVPADETILMAADLAGIDIPGDCMEGTCGACETRVIEGEVDHRDSVLSAQARAEGDTMMICVSRAKGKRLIIDL